MNTFSKCYIQQLSMPSEHNYDKEKKNGINLLHILSRIQLTLTTLPWKLNRFLFG
jgi:hypothetical protein